MLVKTPVTIVGNVHGQFEDLIEIFEEFGSCPAVNYLFLGGYVDRGHRSFDTFVYLMALKVMHPDRIVLLRGNHESKDIC